MKTLQPDPYYPNSPHVPTVERYSNDPPPPAPLPPPFQKRDATEYRSPPKNARSSYRDPGALSAFSGQIFHPIKNPPALLHCNHRELPAGSNHIALPIHPPAQPLLYI